MTERDRSKVTLVLSEAEARWLRQEMEALNRVNAVIGARSVILPEILHEINHALAECDCAESKTWSR